jgi:hypothetical protein
LQTGSRTPPGSSADCKDHRTTSHSVRSPDETIALQADTDSIPEQHRARVVHDKALGDPPSLCAAGLPSSVAESKAESTELLASRPSLDIPEASTEKSASRVACSDPERTCPHPNTAPMATQLTGAACPASPRRVTVLCARAAICPMSHTRKLLSLSTGRTLARLPSWDMAPRQNSLAARMNCIGVGPSLTRRLRKFGRGHAR